MPSVANSASQRTGAAPVNSPDLTASPNDIVDPVVPLKDSVVAQPPSRDAASLASPTEIAPTPHRRRSFSESFFPRLAPSSREGTQEPRHNPPLGAQMELGLVITDVNDNPTAPQALLPRTLAATRNSTRSSGTRASGSAPVKLPSMPQLSSDGCRASPVRVARKTNRAANQSVTRSAKNPRVRSKPGAGPTTDDKGQYVFKSGDIIADKFQVRRMKPIGRGAFGVVVEAQNLDSGRKCAVKVHSSHGAMGTVVEKELAVLRYLRSNMPAPPKREEDGAIAVSEGSEGDGGDCFVQGAPAPRPAIQEFLGALQWGPHTCLVSELLGPSLRQVLANLPHRRMHLVLVRSIGKHLLSALTFLENLDRPVIHGDIKLENILLDLPTMKRLCQGQYEKLGQGQRDCVPELPEDFRVCLIDFGCARRLQRKAPEDTARVGYIQSRWYRAPEVCLGLPCCTRVDLWSVATVLAELASGRVLFRARDSQSMIRQFTSVLGPLPAAVVAQQRTLADADQQKAKVSAKLRQRILRLFDWKRRSRGPNHTQDFDWSRAVKVESLPPSLFEDLRPGVQRTCFQPAKRKRRLEESIGTILRTFPKSDSDAFVDLLNITLVYPTQGRPLASQVEGHHFFTQQPHGTESQEDAAAAEAAAAAHCLMLMASSSAHELVLEPMDLEPAQDRDPGPHVPVEQHHPNAPAQQGPRGSNVPGTALPETEVRGGRESRVRTQAAGQASSGPQVDLFPSLAPGEGLRPGSGPSQHLQHATGATTEAQAQPPAPERSDEGRRTQAWSVDFD